VRAGELRVGTSGFHYPWWRRTFYPDGLRPADWFAHYARVFDTVEINNSFYRLPEASTFRAWREQAPVGFLYAVKFSKFGTHNKKLKDPDATIGLFLERAEELGDRLGPILVQLPPKWRCDAGRLDAFLAAAPKVHRWVVEFRDPTWLCEDVYRVLEKHGAAFCIHDRVEGCPWRLTADWTYLRFHGPGGTRGKYPDEFLRNDADRVRRTLEQGIGVYAYFNNDLEAFAVGDARLFRAGAIGRDRIAPRRARPARKGADMLSTRTAKRPRGRMKEGS
jgi:uncharacterized protein YecE (DUF72 family)